ncbi:MAG: LacI family DNA-binding transcriptional regulator [Opitutales bacterium]|jgi:LacI family repressor for deo operon, udp, cdd, tsx, nupC, and nupG|nr:LacI family DNA-binding transcriptional regulator [Opitutales bacterium]MBT5169904.1 LacI family DNA-binding transcriptional regulator [Opitutales bacterium]MBT5815360.1 LacI family DNA-binding transcriptional regulator [Opitutales bacterium]MBT6380273.1 LacI family DNA-binding transcriptional regulator [Opitutales bacterium]MBT6770602.1 LacI family DNA-binding transcriptional regulator [Opitutales bacterium]
MPKPNQKQIADQLELSRTTVSRCFTNHPKINPETRSKVFQLAAELGYSYSIQRNAHAKTDSTRNTIAIIVGIEKSATQSKEPAAEILNGISEKAAAEGLEIEIHYVDPSKFLPSSRSRRIIKGVSCLHWKGVVLVYDFQEEAVSNIMAKFPTVSALEDYDDVDVDCIGQDQVRGISRIMQHLHELGHRRIGFLSWKYPVHTPWVERRLGAYVENIYRLGLELDTDLILNLKPDEQTPLDELAAQVAERANQGVSAWVCAADHQAYHLIDQLKTHGINVPEDCSVTGYDGQPPTEGTQQVTTIRMPFKDIGISCISSLLRKMKHPVASRRNLQVSGELLIGSTTAAPLQRAIA